MMVSYNSQFCQCTIERRVRRGSTEPVIACPMCGMPVSDYVEADPESPPAENLNRAQKRAKKFGHNRKPVPSTRRVGTNNIGKRFRIGGI